MQGSKNDKSNTSSEIAFSILLNKYLNYDGTIDEFLETIRQIKDKKETSKIEKTLLKLILALNPKTQAYKTSDNQELILNIIKYLVQMKEKKLSPDPVEVFDIFSTFFSKDPLFKNLFDKKDNLNNKEESYLEMIIPFVPDKQINLIINVLKNYLEEKEVKFVEKALKDLNLKFDKSYIFLKKILIGIINSNFDIIQEIQTIMNNFFDNEKNEFFRCDKCYNFPILYQDQDKKINIKYSCNHFEEKAILQPEKILDSKPKCFNCKECLHSIYKNFQCSNCKNLFCNDCLQIHFNICLTLFFIPFSDVGLICSDHNLKYDTFCSICNKNLCSLCKEEHEHFSNYSKGSLDEIDKKEIEDFINSDNVSNDHFKKLIKMIISDKKYFDNFQFHYFLTNLIGKNIKFDCGFFKEFGNKEFNQYYSTLINKYTKGNVYYRKIYNEIKNSYIGENIKVNTQESDIDVLLMRMQRDSKAYSDNSFKTSLLINYFTSLNELKDKIKQEKNISEEDILKINKEKSDIKANSFLFHSNIYRVKVMRLLDRSIANNILRHLIIKYHNHFKKVNCDLNIYNDIKENFPKNDLLIEKFENKNRNIINKIKTNLNSNSTNSGIDTSNTENSADIKFESSITIKNKTISVQDLNIILKYLFYIKDGGNDVAQPNRNNNDYSISSIQNKIDKDDSQKNFSFNDISAFIKDLSNIFQNYKFKDNITNKCLLECLFDKKYENILSKVETDSVRKINEIIDQGKDLNFKQQIDEEFKNLDESLNSLKLLYNSLIKYGNKETKKDNSLNQFYVRLYKSFNNKESALVLLTNLMNFSYENSLFDNMTMFISDCFNFIIYNLLEKHENIISQLEDEIMRMKIERNDNRIILQTFKKLNKKTTSLDEKEKENNSASFVNGFVNYLIKQKVFEEDNIDYSEGNNIIESVKTNLEILIKEKVEWSKKREVKISSLLCLYQNQV